MTRAERIAYYRKILLESTNRQTAIDKIVTDVNSLVWTDTGKPLTRAERIELLDAIFKDWPLRKSFPNLESFERQYQINDSVTGADNSHILDVISALKRGAKD
jgi:hypothetical protein